jgi:hypothetical protein
MKRRVCWIVGCLLAVPALVIGCECSIRGGHDAAHKVWNADVKKCFSEDMIGRSIKETSILALGIGEVRPSGSISPTGADIIDSVGDKDKPPARTMGCYFAPPTGARFPHSCWDEGLIFRLDKQDRILWIGYWMH